LAEGELECVAGEFKRFKMRAFGNELHAEEFLDALEEPVSVVDEARTGGAVVIDHAKSAFQAPVQLRIQPA